MSIGSLIVTLILVVVGLSLVGFALHLAITYVPMPEPFKRVIVPVVVGLIILLVLLWLLRFNR